MMLWDLIQSSRDGIAVRAIRLRGDRYIGAKSFGPFSRPLCNQIKTYVLSYFSFILNLGLRVETLINPLYVRTIIRCSSFL